MNLAHDQFRKDFGRTGEALAVEFLKAKGIPILVTNFRCRGGEIDIIAQDAKTIVFVEVKTRHSTHYGEGQEAVSFFKQQRMVKTALFYLQSQRWPEFQLRFDVISILWDERGQARIEHLENAFEPDGYDL